LFSFTIKNVSLHHLNLSDIIFDCPATITLKAVGSIDNYLPLFRTESKITIFFYKGPRFNDNERKLLDNFRDDWELVEEKSLAVKDAGDRLLVGLRNKDVLRGTFVKNQQHIKLTSLL